MNKYFPDVTAKDYELDEKITSKKIYKPGIGEVLISSITKEIAELLISKGAKFIWRKGVVNKELKAEEKKETLTIKGDLKEKIS